MLTQNAYKTLLKKCGRVKSFAFRSSSQKNNAAFGIRGQLVYYIWR